MSTEPHAQGTANIGRKQYPPMAIGTWAWGDKREWDYKPEDFEDIRKVWHACNKSGLTFYDTAEIYGSGESERIIGRLLKETDAETKKNIAIATKFLPFPGPMHFWVLNPPFVKALRGSLERLGLESVDLYQIHSGSGVGTWESWAAGLAECQKLGLTKSVGVSNFSKEDIIKFSDLLEKHGVKLASNQVEYSLLRQSPETSGLFDEMKKRGIALLAYSPLAQGKLTGKYSKENPMPSHRKFQNTDISWDDMDPLVQELKSLAKKYDVTPAAVALNWVICKGAIPLGGARNQKQAQENARASTFRLTAEEVESLSKRGFEGKQVKMGGIAFQRG